MTPRSSGWQQRRPARKTANPYDSAWRRVRLAVLNRDGWVCQLCKVDLRSLPKGSAHVDHVQPLSEAPHRRLDPTNLRALCRKCNLRLGAQLGYKRQQQRKPTVWRIW